MIFARGSSRRDTKESDPEVFGATTKVIDILQQEKSTM